MAQQVINAEAVAYKHEQQPVFQQTLMSLSADTVLPDLCDEKDVTIAILEGCGSLTLCRLVGSILEYFSLKGRILFSLPVLRDAIVWHLCNCERNNVNLPQSNHAYFA